MLAALLAAVVTVFVPGIVTPSGNIHCLGVNGHLLCDIHRAAYSQREQDGCMARSGLDWHGWEFFAGRTPQPVCSGGILYGGTPRYRTLAYGRTWSYGSFTCTSRRVGLMCSTRRHSLFVSRESWTAR